MVVGVKRVVAGALIVALGLSGCTPAASGPGTAPNQHGPAQTTTSGADTPSETSGSMTAPTAPTASETTRFTLREEASFDDPWAMAFLPGARQALITLRTGTLLLYDLDTGEQTIITGTPQPVVAGQGGLGDVAISPTFATDHTIYLSWVEAGEGGTSGAVVGRGRLETGATTILTDLTVVWRQQPKVTGSGHFGHRLLFSPDGRYLFVSSGERQKFDPAQDLTTNLGKILRLNPDGTPAAGNPFADRAGVTKEIWSYGHRNPLGLAFDASGNLWESEMGPMGGDEINLILPGRNYGWPKASNGSNYDGTDIPDHTPSDGFEPPKAWWNPSISPANLMIYTSTRFPAWTGDAFVGGLSGQALIRVHLDGTSATIADTWQLGHRIRAVTQGPDGSIWLLEDGAGARLLELVPA